MEVLQKFEALAKAYERRVGVVREQQVGVHHQHVPEIRTTPQLEADFTKRMKGEMEKLRAAHGRLKSELSAQQTENGKLRKEKAEARKADANAEYRAEEDQIMADYGRVRFYKGDEAAREAEEGVKTRLAKADTLRRKQVRAIDHETSVAVAALEATPLGKRRRCA